VKAIKLTTTQWNNIKKQIAVNYPPSVLLIRQKMKSALGFTVRQHQEYIDSEIMYSGYKTTIHLDFYDDAQRTMFLLRYSECINKVDNQIEII
jgi:hypothetical protein